MQSIMQIQQYPFLWLQPSIPVKKYETGDGQQAILAWTAACSSAGGYAVESDFIQDSPIFFLPSVSVEEYCGPLML